MEQINWRISPAATLARYLFTAETGMSSLPPEWQALVPRIADNAAKLGISPDDFSRCDRFVDALEPLLLSDRLPQLWDGIPEPVTEQITNEISLRTSQLKHHWLVRGPHFLELLEECCPLFNLLVLDLWTTIPIKQTEPSTAPMLLGDSYPAALFSASLHDNNPFIPEVMRPAYVATFFAVKAQLPSDEGGTQRMDRVSLASCRLALTLGSGVELNSVDRPSFETAVGLWLGQPNAQQVDEIWEASAGLHHVADLTDFCLNWIAQPSGGETP
ncbi:MAG: hypothetical protein MK108_14920 [Mariniblastus sp.]|nr:hypothetical protein [Mariniblastus sp.]